MQNAFRVVGGFFYSEFIFVCFIKANYDKYVPQSLNDKK